MNAHELAPLGWASKKWTRKNLEFWIWNLESYNKFLKKSGYIETWGPGTIKIIKECKQAGIPVPVFIYDSSDISVEFRKDIYFAEYLESLGLNERQIKAVKYVKKNGKIINSEYQRLCTVSERTALRDLEELSFKGIFKKMGEKKGTHYELKVSG